MTAPRGILPAVATPLHADFTIDTERLVRHCRDLLARGCDGLNLLGTTGEATSFGIEARLGAMTAVARSGIDLSGSLAGTGAAALDEAVRLTATARDLGFGGALLLPPFYYKGIDQEGLTAYVEAVIGRLGTERLKLYLYHFPRLSGVAWPVEVVEDLHRRHPETVVGLKDSAGEVAYSAELLKRLPGFAVFPGSESLLAHMPDLAFAGCISATVNLTAEKVASFWRAPASAEGRAALAEADAVRAALSSQPLFAAVKWALAERHGESAWNRLVPPLRPLTASEAEALRARLAGAAP